MAVNLKFTRGIFVPNNAINTLVIIAMQHSDLPVLELAKGRTAIKAMRNAKKLMTVTDYTRPAEFALD